MVPGEVPKGSFFCSIDHLFKYLGSNPRGVISRATPNIRINPRVTPHHPFISEFTLIYFIE
jgi:hypothetical protein